MGNNCCCPNTDKNEPHNISSKRPHRQSEMFKLINYNTYNNYNMIYYQNIEAEQSMKRKYETQKFNQRKKVFNPFKDAVVPDYKINKDLDDCQGEGAKRQDVNLSIKEEMESPVMQRSTKSKDFSEMTAIINEQQKKEKCPNNMLAVQNPKKQIIKKNNSKNISFGNFRQSQTYLESGMRKSESSSNKNQDLSFGNLDQESLNQGSEDSVKIQFDQIAKIQDSIVNLDQQSVPVVSQQSQAINSLLFIKKNSTGDSKKKNLDIKKEQARALIQQERQRLKKMKKLEQGNSSSQNSNSENMSTGNGLKIETSEEACLRNQLYDSSVNEISTSLQVGVSLDKSIDQECSLPVSAANKRPSKKHIKLHKVKHKSNQKQTSQHEKIITDYNMQVFSNYLN